MRVLLLTNIIAPIFAKATKRKTVITGGWLHTVVDFLGKRDDISLAVCMPDRTIESVESGVVDNIYYFFFPEKEWDRYSRKTEDCFTKIINDFKPDIVNIFGTEYPRTLAMVNTAVDCKVVITFTGIISIYANHYMGSVPIQLRKQTWRILLKPFINIPTLFDGKKDFIIRGKYEIEAVKKCDYFIGRTRFDKALVRNIRPSAKYYSCNETLRSTFYDKLWDYSKCNRYTVMLPQAGYPIKGFEVFIQALKILKYQYPSIKAIVPGRSSFALKDSMKKKILIFASDYDSYLCKEITKFDLWDNLEFVGLIDEEEMAEKMKSCNVFVLPSAVENSPNTLGEAMLMGMPCVASCVGGVQDMINDNEEGYIYPYDEPHILAYQLATLFDNPDIAIKFGENARNRARKTHNLQDNMNNLLKIYTEISNG